MIMTLSHRVPTHFYSHSLRGAGPCGLQILHDRYGEHRYVPQGTCKHLCKCRSSTGGPLTLTNLLLFSNTSPSDPLLVYFCAYSVIVESLLPFVYVYVYPAVLCLFYGLSISSSLIRLGANIQFLAPARPVVLGVELTALFTK